jgi:GrpB-like predicted nucleotidyltransferase (UPF0157 family)
MLRGPADQAVKLDEIVEIADYDPRWPGRYSSDAAEVVRVLGGRVSAIEHFGSTAVPGMSAKPIVDVLVGLAHWPMQSSDCEALQALGYEYLGEAGVAGREYFRRRGALDTNLAIVEWRGRLWKDNLLLRDYLRAHPAAAAAYSQSKRAAWSSGARSLLAYSAAKAATMDEMLESAREWGRLGSRNDAVSAGAGREADT